MQLPDYWLTRPTVPLTAETRADFDQLLAELRSAGATPLIDYRFAAPKWLFLCYLADQWGVVLHGTGDPGIQRFEPRPSSDLTAFGAQTAVYAARDGLWPLFFAVVDRTRYALTTTNACVQLVDPAGQASPPYYVFGISQAALAQQPWRAGTVYLLPGDTFVNQPSLSFGDYEVRVPQLASLAPVTPFARLAVTPADFPFLQDIRGIDDDRLAEYGQAMQTGGPWPE
jgi:hypothetical protein